MVGRSSGNYKRTSATNKFNRKRKRRKIEKLIADVGNPSFDDWKLNMGTSLADRLEAIASDNNLTILQVKRLLKDVLTNPAVVSAFRQYMSGQLILLEPETGAASTSTRRHAQNLGFDLSAFGPRSSIMDILSRRSVTRSLARKLRNEVANNNVTLPLPNDISNSLTVALGVQNEPKAATLLDMNFSDGDDEEEPTIVKSVESRVVENTSDSVFSHVRDEDYQPTIEDMNIMHRDILYDLEDTEIKSISSSGKEDQDIGDDLDSPTSSLCTVEPLDSPHRDYFLRSRKSDEVNMQDCLSGLTPNILNLLDEDEGDEEVEINAQRFADALSAPNNFNEADPEDRIYTSFLKSLVDSTIDLPPDISSPQMRFQHVDPMLNQDASETCLESLDVPPHHEEFDDPDFDVMAELDCVSCDDLFDELRCDRAVRISKMEAKELRRELAELLNEDDIFDLEAEFSTQIKVPASATLTTKESTPLHESFPSTSHPPLPPPPFEYDTNERLRRQLSMLVQLLCSTLACCVHRADLEESVCNVVREAFIDLHSAFRFAKSNPYTYVTGLSKLDDLFSSAFSFISEFAGFTFLPLSPINSHPPLLPLPFNLLDFISRSPIWAYPHLLPRGLAPRPHRYAKRPFTQDDDDLIVLGLANLIEFAPHRFNLFADSLQRHKKAGDSEESVNAMKRSKVFAFITKTLLPTKSTAQLHNRKLYMEKAIRRDWLNVRSLTTKSSLCLLMVDLLSGQFEGVEAQRELLRACISSFVRRTFNGGLLCGSIFSRSDCWSLLPLEYASCCRTLQEQLEAGATGSPQPSESVLLPVFIENGPHNKEFFLNALLTWWPSNADVRDGKEFEIEEVSAFIAPTPPIRMPQTNMVYVVPYRTTSVYTVPVSVTTDMSQPLQNQPITSAPRKTHSASLSKIYHPRSTQQKCSPQAPALKSSSPASSSISTGGRNHVSPQFLPQVSEIINTFHVGLDRVLRGLPPPPRSRSSTATTATLTSRLLRSCRRETSAWLPSIVPTVGKEADEIDVRRARCLLDRCRLHLGRHTHAEIIRALAEYQPVIPLQRILQLLSPSRPLWEEFVSLCLTPEQARSLRLYPIYAHLQRVGEIHSLLRASLPRAKRLWSRLRKLADAREGEEIHIPVFGGNPSFFDSPRKRPRRRRRRYKVGLQNEDEEGGVEKQKPARDVYKSTWSLLETALKERYALHAQTAISLDPFQKPYSNFPQTFEVVDTLARKPATSPKHAPSLQRIPSSKFPPEPLPRLLDVFSSPIKDNSSLEEAFMESLRWEVSTELSSSAPATAKSKLANRCPCPCHDEKRKSSGVSAPQTPSLMHHADISTPTVGGSGKCAAKADSLGLRHCIKCSLRVHQGVVYVDECNFHLTRVQITWPEGFTPPNESFPSCTYIVPPTFTSLLPCPSSSSLSPFVGGSPTFSSSLSTQQVLQVLGAYHNNVSDAAFKGIVPDLARRQVSVDFEEMIFPTSRKSLDLPPGTPNTASSLITDESVKTVTSGSCNFSSPSFPSSIFQAPPVEVDDEACFNTEAFPQRSDGEDDDDRVISIMSAGVEQSSSWSMSDDRRLLEYLRSMGRCSRRLFSKLAAHWPERSLEEIMARFKYLMLVAYGEDCNMEISACECTGAYGMACEGCLEASDDLVESDHDMEEEATKVPEED